MILLNVTGRERRAEREAGKMDEEKKKSASVTVIHNFEGEKSQPETHN